VNCGISYDAGDGTAVEPCPRCSKSSSEGKGKTPVDEAVNSLPLEHLAFPFLPRVGKGFVWVVLTFGDLLVTYPAGVRFEQVNCMRIEHAAQNGQLASVGGTLLLFKRLKAWRLIEQEPKGDYYAFTPQGLLLYYMLEAARSCG
jgi:hypothetical protein